VTRAIYCGHARMMVASHGTRLEFGVDRFVVPPIYGVVDVRWRPRRKYPSPRWPKAWPKPPTWTYTWLVVGLAASPEAE